MLSAEVLIAYGRNCFRCFGDDVLFCLHVVDCVMITYNAALNRPAYQTNVYQGAYPARFANDGSRHTTWNTGTKCAVAHRTNDPWWVVDLGRPTSINRVDLTSGAGT